MPNAATKFSLKKQYLLNIAKLHLPEFTKEKAAIIKEVEALNKKLDEKMQLLSFDKADSNSFVNKHLQDFEDMCAEMQQHYSVDVKQCSTITWFTYLNHIKKKYDQIKSTSNSKAALR